MVGESGGKGRSVGCDIDAVGESADYHDRVGAFVGKTADKVFDKCCAIGCGVACADD